MDEDKDKDKDKAHEEGTYLDLPNEYHSTGILHTYVPIPLESRESRAGKAARRDSSLVARRPVASGRCQLSVVSALGSRRGHRVLREQP